jgi:hypothetical protein
MIATRSELSAIEWIPLLSAQGMIHSDAKVRISCLKVVLAILESGKILKPNPLLESRLYLLRFDNDPSVRACAEQIKSLIEKSVPVSYWSSLIPLLSIDDAAINDAAARALSHGLLSHPSISSDVISNLLEVYSASMPVHINDNVSKASNPNKIISKQNNSSIDQDKKWSTRAAVALTLQELGRMKSITIDHNETLITQLLEFIVEKGVVDKNESVAASMQCAGKELIDGYGASMLDQMMSYFELVLRQSPDMSCDIEEHDKRHTAVVILLGETGMIII